MDHPISAGAHDDYANALALAAAVASKKPGRPMFAGWGDRAKREFRVGLSPQHVVPSYDLKTLWVTNNAKGRPDGSLTPIDPTVGKPLPVDDPYNMYFTPDGRSAIVVAEALKRLDFCDPQTMELQGSIPTPPVRRDQSRRLLDRWPARAHTSAAAESGARDAPGVP